MTMQINIQINADADGGFTASEQSILSALSGNAPAAAAETTPAPAAPAPAKAEPKRRGPVAKAKPVQEDPEPEVEEEAAEAGEEEPEDEPEEPAKPARRAPVKKAAADEVTYVVRDAINAATPLISEGAAGRAKVKAALGAVPGAAKVSDLKKHEDIAAFLEALEA